MKTTKLTFLPTVFMLAVGTCTASAIVLTFEGLQDHESINDFYNGGTGSLGSSGTNYGISFTPDSLALTSGNYGNNPSPPTIAFFLTGAGDTMNVAGGFNTGFSFYYAAYQAGQVNVYDGLNGTGTLLATLPLPATTNAAYVWVPVGVTFSGTAKSVLFGGAADKIGFDDVTLGSSTAGDVPDGGTTASLMGLAMLGLGAMRRKLS